jgi:predicted  nucleic acid-binding Zn-ribbon protein
MNHELKSRQEIEEKSTQYDQDFDANGGDLTQYTVECQTIRGTLNHLHGGTQEGFKEVSDHIEAARDVTVEKFDETGQHLEELEQENLSYQGELEDSRDAAHHDVEELDSIKGQIRTQEAQSDLEQATCSAQQDIEQLQTQISRAQSSREEAHREYESLKQQISSYKE